MKDELKDVLRAILGAAIATVIAIMCTELLCGCRTQKNIAEAVSQKANEQSSYEEGRTGQTSGSLGYHHAENRTTDTETEAFVEFFDMDHPPDSITGERPVKARATIRQRSSGSTVIDDSVQAHTSTVFADSMKVEHCKADSLERATESKKTRGSDRAIWTEIVCGVFCLLLLVTAMCYLLVKKR